MLSVAEAQAIVEDYIASHEYYSAVNKGFYCEDNEYYYIPIILAPKAVGIPGAGSMHFVHKVTGKITSTGYHPFTSWGERLENMTRVDLN